MSSGRPAVFLDRDGTLIEDLGFLRSPSEVKLIPGAIEALHKLRDQFLYFIVTNQSGVGHGHITGEDVERVNSYLVGLLRDQGIEIREVYVCPHTAEDQCACRKPRPHFLERAARDHGVELARSWAIGDHPCDVELADNAGARGIYVLTGHGAKHRAKLKLSPPVVADLPAAIDLIAAAHAAAVLKRGGLVAFPTETVYGLGADVERVEAIKNIFAVKGRPENHPLIVHIPGADRLSEWAASVPAAARELAQRFWPGPLTMILPKGPKIPAAVTGGQDTVGLRVPGHPLALAMLREHQGAIAAPSANRFGKVSPTTAQHVGDDLGEEVDFILDGGACAVGIESTIVDLSAGTATILRPGGVTREQLEEALGGPISTKADREVRAPGMLESHYAPNARVLLADRDQLDALVAQSARFALIAAPGSAPARAREQAIFVLEAAPETLAHELYAALREADRRGAELVIVEKPREEGLGLALLDRLKKAAAKG